MAKQSTEQSTKQSTEQSTKQVFDSLDLVRHIYGFGPEHRDNLNPVLRSLLDPSDKDLGIRPGMEVMPIRMFRKANRCHCCTRHCHRKPAMLIHQNRLFFAMEILLHVPEERKVEDCECECRHLMRRLTGIHL